ncbi:ashwin-like [Watersipora subatra]|uniref:ashwin-like n=1 Tax=Watersipora subatra TaxID=2589382 RepID=UPI00355B72B4
MSGDLLHPEMMDTAQLVEILKERNLSDIDEYDKNALIEAFYTHVLPLPQRQHRSNREGLQLRESQGHHRDVEEKRVTFSDRCQIRTICSEISPTTVVSNSIPAEGDARAVKKRPSSTINFENKRIKLTGSTVSPDIKGSKREAPLDSEKTHEPPKKHARTKITWP